MTHSAADCTNINHDHGIACRYDEWGTPSPWCLRHHNGRQCDSCAEDGNRQCYPLDRLSYVQFADEPDAWLMCADCIADYGDELQRCHDCLTYYHADTHLMAGAICLACEERHIEEDACDPEMAGVA